MNIAVITGASSGLGAAYAKAVDKYCENIDEIWLTARRKERLEKLAKELYHPCRAIDFDLTDSEGMAHYKEMLEIYEANVRLLINNAGFGKYGDFADIPTADNAGMIRLNCEALTVTTSVTLPFMRAGAQIINTSSIASFVPNTRLAVYSSTKAYVTSFSRALREELKKRRINVLAVCPGPMETEFFAVANIKKGTSKTFDMLPRVRVKRIAKKSLAASKKGRGVYTDRAFYKFYRFVSKIVPHSIMIKIVGA